MIKIIIICLFLIGTIIRGIIMSRKGKEEHRKYKIEKAKRVLWWSNFMDERAGRNRKIDEMRR